MFSQQDCRNFWKIQELLKLNCLDVEYSHILRMFCLHHQVSYLMMFMLHLSLLWKDSVKV